MASQLLGMRMVRKSLMENILLGMKVVGCLKGLGLKMESWLIGETELGVKYRNIKILRDIS